MMVKKLSALSSVRFWSCSTITKDTPLAQVLGAVPRCANGLKRPVRLCATLHGMADPLTASDFWPLILKLPHDERVRLAKLALRAAADAGADAAAYASAPPKEDEFASEDEQLAWEAEGWEEFGAQG